MVQVMKSFKEFEKDTIFTYEWSEFVERTDMTECLPDNNMVTIATSHSNTEIDTHRHNGTHHDTL